MLQGGHLAIMQARNRTEFRDELVRYAKNAGFDYISATAIIDHVVGDTEFVTAGNTPEAYLATAENVAACRRDPVMQHCKTRSVPIIWDQKTYVEHDRADKWEEQARFGY